MPSILFTGTPLDALNLFHMTKRMTGAKQYRPHREAVRNRIESVWPEPFSPGGISSATPKGKKLIAEKRNMTISPEEQHVLAEGFLELLTGVLDSSTKKLVVPNDQESEIIIATAKRCKVSKWVEDQVAKDEVPAFTESDEKPVSDKSVKPGKGGGKK